MKRIIFFIIIVSIGFMSCKKNFLEVSDKTTVIREAYVKDLKSTGEYLNGAYSFLSSNFYTATTHMYADVVADNLKTTSNSYMGVFNSWSQRADEDATN